jgi:flagellar biosynthesis protein FlhG
MKSIKEQTYYEILEVSPTAKEKEIQMAYEHAKETFQDDSLAIYSLFSEEEVKEIQSAVEEAHRVLTDEALRRNYDQSRFQMVGGPPEKPFETQEVFREKKTSLSFTGISFNPDEELYRGKTLKQIREKIGVELQMISQETKISLKVLECIEEEAFENLPALVYLKGFLRGYAQSLGLDPQKVIEEYLRLIEESKKK